MEGVFRADSKLYQIVEKIVNLVKLNMIWILFCIPIVTIGAANAALHEIALQILNAEEGYIVPSFYKAFRKNWKKATKLWIPLFVVGIGIYMDVMFWQQINGVVADTMKGLVLVIGMLYLFLSIYSYPLTVHMETGVKLTIQNSALLAFKYLPKTIYMAVWIGILWMIGKIWAIGLLIQILMGGSMAAVLHAAVLKKIFENEKIIEPMENNKELECSKVEKETNG